MTLRASVLVVSLFASVSSLAQVTPPTPPPQHAAASQIHSSADAQLQASVRRAIQNDNGVSDLGHHVTVIVADGAVVLRGQVKNDAEKTHIDTLVRQVGGVKELTNELDVKPPPTN